MSDEEKKTEDIFKDLGLDSYKYTADLYQSNDDIHNMFQLSEHDTEKGIGETSGTITSQSEQELSVDELKSTDEFLRKLKTPLETPVTSQGSEEEKEKSNNELAVEDPFEPDPEVETETICRTEVPPKETSDCTVLGSGDVVGPQVDFRNEEARDTSNNGLVVEQSLESDPVVVYEIELPPRESPEGTTIATIDCPQLSVIETEASTHGSGNTTNRKQGTKRKSDADLDIQDNRTRNRKVPKYKMELTGDKKLDASIRSARNVENARQRVKDKMADLEKDNVQKDQEIADLKKENADVNVQKDLEVADLKKVIVQKDLEIADLKKVIVQKTWKYEP